MKILLVSDSFPPVVSGLATVSYEYARAFARRGHQITVCAIHPALVFLHENLFPNCAVYRFPSFPIPFRNNAYFSIASPFVLFQIINRHKPDIIHIHSFGPLGIASIIIGTIYGIPLVATCHGIPPFITSYLPWIQKSIRSKIELGLWKISTYLFNKFDHCIAPSEFILSSMKGHGVTAPTSVIPFWINTIRKVKHAQIKAKQLWHIDEKKQVFLYFGRLDPDKHIDGIIQAISLLKKMIPGQIYTSQLFLFAGIGNEKGKLYRLAIQSGVENETMFPGFIPEQLIPLLYSRAQAFIISAPFEAQSIVTLQAISSGLPVFAADQGALVSIATRFSKQCFTFPSGNPYQLALLLKQFILNSQKMYQPGKKLFTHTYAKKTVLKQIETLYVSVVKQKKSSIS